MGFKNGHFTSDSGSGALSGVSADFADKGFQDFIATDYLTAVNGAPSTGQFRSDITNRKPIVNLANDLKPRLGMERFLTPYIVDIQDEFGPANEKVYKSPTDYRDLCRMVGSWSNRADTSGTGVQTTTVNDYIEIVFYGTSLNLLMLVNSTSRDYRASIDGAAEGTNLHPTNPSNVLDGRSYNTNQVIPIAFGLSLGIHTVKIRNNSANGIIIFGYEVCTSATAIKVPTGDAFIDGTKVTHSSAEDISHNSGFETGTLGTKGGRVIMYMKSTGTIAKSVTPTDTSQLNMTSADHTNEEIARAPFWREFGTGRSDDFSTLLTSNSDRAFVLDDGSTNLNGDETIFLSTANPDLAVNANGGSVSITFTGTGLDILRYDQVGADNFTVHIDGGSSIGTITMTSTTLRQTKIVSGLPYGTHTVRFQRNGFSTGHLMIRQFIIYQPKTPTLPSGSIELARYNLMADFAVNSGSNQRAISTGVLAKMNMREMNYNGPVSLSASISDIAITSGFIVSGTGTGENIEYAFFGTGFEFDARDDGTAVTWIVQVDGANYTGAATATGTGTSWTPGTSTFGAGGNGGSVVDGTSKLSVTGLTLGYHRVKFTSGGTGSIRFRQLNIITPIHAYEIRSQGDIQPNLWLGSLGICHNYSDTPVKGKDSGNSTISTNYLLQSNTTTSSTGAVPTPFSVSIYVNNKPIEINFTGNLVNSTSGGLTYLFFYVDGQPIFGTRHQSASGNEALITMNHVITLSPGFHNIKLYWAVGVGTATIAGGPLSGNSTQAALSVREI